jgi:hypothetical protein
VLMVVLQLDGCCCPFCTENMLVIVIEFVFKSIFYLEIY